MTDITEFPIPTIKLSELPAAVTIAGVTDLVGLQGGDYVLVYLKALGLTSDTYQINFQCYDDLDDPVGGVQSDSFYTGRSVQNNENFTGYVRMVDEVETAAYMRITIFCNNEKIDTRIVGVHRA